jgi:hypothetical protein
MAGIVSRRHLGKTLLGAAAAVIGGSTLRQANAAMLPQPSGKAILTIAGRITTTNEAGTARFDRDMLERLGVSGFQTSTPWYDGLVQFEGVRMDRLMQEVGAAGDTVVAYALNDYSTKIPMADFARYDVILALKRDGEYMPVRDKGPLFIVYPYDSSPELKHQRFYSRSAWQVAKLVVE